MSPKTAEIVDEFSRMKRMIVVDTGDAPLSKLGDDEWIYFGVLDEVVHEDSHQYFWDLALNHEEFLAADVPIRTVFGTADEEGLVETRLVRRGALASFKFDGDGFSCSIPTEKRAPSGGVPSPVWKFAWAFPGDSSMLEYEPAQGALVGASGLPRSIIRLAGRYCYTPPYMK